MRLIRVCVCGFKSVHGITVKMSLRGYVQTHLHAISNMPHVDGTCDRGSVDVMHDVFTAPDSVWGVTGSS